MLSGFLLFDADTGALELDFLQILETFCWLQG